LVGSLAEDLRTLGEMRDVRHALALRRHQHHDRPPQLHRVFGRAANPLQPPALGHRDRPDENLRGTPHHHLRELAATSLAHPLKINDAQRSWPAPP
jgi:hypothetical protein